MSKYSIIITLAIWTIILPFLGFPSFWRILFIFLSGLGIIFYTLALRSESLNNRSFSFKKRNDVYTENGTSDNEERIEEKN